ncbi:MAG: penicillin acylase family protein [Acidobacteriota bacterium]
MDGEVPLAGLRAPVEVLFDTYGVPHVYARDPEDAWFAAGALHARDRLWQMELYRRAADGRLSEMLGESALPADRRLLTLGLRDAAEREWRTTGPAARRMLQRYAAGVNAVAGAQRGRQRPIELQLLGVMPQPWTPSDSLAVGRLLAWRLAENHQAELVRAALTARVGEGEALRLTGGYPREAPETVARHEGPAPGLPTPGAGAARPARWPRGLEWLDPTAKRGNSNAWVLAPSRTATGRPILANDPHLLIEFPSVWYELHLVARDLDVTGVTVPGAPVIPIGHNARIAWGMTNTGADVQDLFLERLDVARRRVWRPGGWQPVEVQAADIPVRGRAPEPFEVWRTSNGPVFADTSLDWREPPRWLSPAAPREGEARAYALRWAGLDGEIAGAFEALHRASTWREFTAAVERFATPSQNAFFADVDGNIGYAMSGVLPVRASGDGRLPRAGGAGDGRWAGRVDPATLPRAFNPPAGWIASSNNEIDRDWPGLITRDWMAPFRITRLAALLGEHDRLDLDGVAAIQNDTRNEAAALIVAALPRAAAAAGRRGAPAEVVRGLERLAAWTRVVDGGPDAALFEVFEDALWRRTFADELGADLFDVFYDWAGAERMAGLYVVVGTPESRWFDDIGTLERRETWDDVAALAMADALERLRSEQGGEWSWARLHAARFDHPLAAAAAPLGWLLSRGPVPVAGDIYTVMRVSYRRTGGFAAWEHPSWRQVLDVGQWDASRVVLPAGQSGHPLSAHYFDQNALWRAGQYRPHSFSREAVERARAGRVVMVPAGMANGEWRMAKEEGVVNPFRHSPFVIRHSSF